MTSAGSDRLAFLPDWQTSASLPMADVASRPGVPLGAPLYRELVRLLMEALTRGEWKPGEAIPAERQLAGRFGVSVGTVRKAIDTLVAANILIRQQGRGTFVTSHNRDRMLFYFFHIVPEDRPKVYPEVRLLSFTRARAGTVEAARLDIAQGAPVLQIRNLLSLAGSPIIVDALTLSAVRFARLTERQFRDRPSTIYNLYEDSFGVSVVRTRERLRATLADAETATLLGVPVGAPLLQIRRVALTYRDEPVEYRVSLVNTAAHEYFAEIGAT